MEERPSGSSLRYGETRVGLSFAIPSTHISSVEYFVGVQCNTSWLLS